MTIETRQLRYFVAVAEESHFGRAAERLRIAQPSLSQQVKQLEKSLDTELLVRTTRNVELTPAGQLLLNRGKQILEDLDSVELNTRRVGEGLEGLLHVGFTGAATYGLMPRVVREAGQRFPELQLDVTGEHLTPSLVAGLESNRIDVAVLRPPVTSTDVAFEVVTTERLIAAVSADSTLASLPSIRLEDFTGKDFVGYPPNSAVGQAVATSFLQRGIEPVYLPPVSETSTLLSLVAAGIGVALVPESATSIQIGGTVYLPVVEAPNVELAIAWRRSDSSPAVLRFVEFVKSLMVKVSV